jgi:hypothetical protein
MASQWSVIQIYRFLGFSYFFHWEIKPRGDRNEWWNLSRFKESVLSTHESMFRELQEFVTIKRYWIEGLWRKEFGKVF